MQPTHELACLQAAIQWGDTSGAARIRELADALSLPLANTVARYAESLLAGDGDGLLAASADYREIGDRATAADAAAQAAVALSGGAVGQARPVRRGVGAAAGRRMWRPVHTGAAQSCGQPVPVDRPSARDRRIGGRGPVQPGNRQPPHDVGAHCRGTPVPSVSAGREPSPAATSLR